MLSWEYPPHSVGGLGKHVSELVPALAAEGIEVHLVTPRFMGHDHYSIEAGTNGEGQVHVYRVDPSNPGDFYSTALQTNLQMHEKAYEILDQSGPFDLDSCTRLVGSFCG